MGSNSSSYSSKGCTVNNEGQESVINTIKHGKPDHSIYITDVYWNYKSAGRNNFHRFLEIKFCCNNCNFTKYVRTDKTNNGSKNICCADGLLKQGGLLWYWHKKPKNHYTIHNLIDVINDAKSGYSLGYNNCRLYAEYIWDRIN